MEEKGKVYRHGRGVEKKVSMETRDVFQEIRTEQVNKEEEKKEQRSKNMKGCHKAGKHIRQEKGGKNGMKTKSLVLTSPPPAAHPSCIHLDGYRRS